MIIMPENCFYLWKFWFKTFLQRLEILCAWISCFIQVLMRRLCVDRPGSCFCAWICLRECLGVIYQSMMCLVFSVRAWNWSESRSQIRVKHGCRSGFWRLVQLRAGLRLVARSGPCLRILGCGWCGWVGSGLCMSRLVVARSCMRDLCFLPSLRCEFCMVYGVVRPWSRGGPRVWRVG